MMMLQEALKARPIPTPPPAARPASVDPFDPVIRAIMACDGVGRDKTIALVLSALEAAFPS